MHYQDGTEVKVSDLVHSKSRPADVAKYTQYEYIGTVVGGQPITETCNLQILVFAVRELGPLGTSAWRQTSSGLSQLVTAGDCLKVELP